MRLTFWRKRKLTPAPCVVCGNSRREKLPGTACCIYPMCLDLYSRAHAFFLGLQVSDPAPFTGDLLEGIDA